MRVYASGELEIDEARGELRRSGARVSTEPKVLGLLLMLLEAAGRVVSQEEILARLWPEVRVSSDAVYRVVKEARAAVADDGRRQAVIRTLPGRGWQWVADYTTHEVGAPAGTGDDPLAGLRAEIAAGRVPEARARALEIAGGGPEPGEERARALILAADVLVHGRVDREWLAAAEAVLEALPSDASALRAELSCRIAYQLYWSREAGRSRSANAEARRLAESAGASDVLAWVDLVDHMHCEGPGALAARRRHAESAVRHAVRAGTAQTELWAREQVAHDAMEAGDLKRVEAEAERIALLAERSDLIWAGRVETLLQLHRGDLPGAERALLRELARLRDAGPIVFQYLGGPILWLRAEQGRLAEVIDLLRQFVAAGAELAIWRSALARAEWLVGNEEVARREYEGLAADGFRSVGDVFVAPATLAHLAELCASFDDRARCAWLRERLGPYAGRLIVVPRASFSLGPADLPLARLARLAGDVEAARRHLDAALDLCERTGARPARVHAHLAGVELLRDGDEEDVAEAARHAEEATALAEALGMGDVARRATTKRGGGRRA